LSADVYSETIHYEQLSIISKVIRRLGKKFTQIWGKSSQISSPNCRQTKKAQYLQQSSIGKYKTSTSNPFLSIRIATTNHISPKNLPEPLKSRPNCKILPNLVTLIIRPDVHEFF
jgi:hypothetical protein